MNNCLYCKSTAKCRHCLGSGVAQTENAPSIDNYIDCPRCQGTGKCEWCAWAPRRGGSPHPGAFRRPSL